MTFRRKRRKTKREIEVIKAKLIGRRERQEKKLEKLRFQQQQIKKQAHSVAGKDEIKLKDLARRHALLEKEEKILANQAALLSNMINAIEAKGFLQSVDSDMREIEKEVGGLGIDKKDYQELMAKLKVTMGETEQVIEEMGSLVNTLAGEDAELTETEESFIHEILAEKETEQMSIEQLQQELDKDQGA